MAAIEREFLDLESTPRGWSALFQRLYQISRLNAGTQLHAKTPLNISRNRYRDVLPIDDTRVKLQDEDNDYINANFVKVEAVNRTYILTQGPLQHTLTHFWQMIWEQNTAGIIMLNKCMERGMNKCTQYWPALGESPMLFSGHYLVESSRCDEEETYRLTHLTLHNLETEESRTILHFHYLCWPDFGVPQTPNVFLEYLLAVRSSGVLEAGVGPSVVHCSAGIGRSGTFCVVDVCLAKLEETRNLDSLNVQELLLDMRKQRFGLIQTPDQLRFSYIAILQGAYNGLGLKNSLRELSEEMQGESDSDSEELVPTDDSEEEEEEEDESKKFPNLNRSYGVSYDEDIPPPIPPRPPDTLPPPPPPPTSLPPGPPEIHYERPPSPSQSRVAQEDEEPFPQVPRGYENGEFSGSESEREEKEEEKPPPIPPRGKSLSPETNSTALVSAASKKLMNGGADHFLGVGRGDAASQSPLSNKSGSTVMAASVSEGEGGQVASSVPPGKSPRERAPEPNSEMEADEEALLMELDELKNLLSEHERRSAGAAAPLGNEVGRTGAPPASQDRESSATELRRRQQREERRDRLANKVSSMRTRDRLHQQQQAPGGDLSVPWLLFGFAVMVGYCVYYLCS